MASSLMWVVDHLLKQGYSVRATIRSANKAAPTKQKYASEYGDKLEFAIVDTKVCINHM